MKKTLLALPLLAIFMCGCAKNDYKMLLHKILEEKWKINTSLIVKEKHKLIKRIDDAYFYESTLYFANYSHTSYVDLGEWDYQNSEYVTRYEGDAVYGVMVFESIYIRKQNEVVTQLSLATAGVTWESSK